MQENHSGVKADFQYSGNNNFYGVGGSIGFSILGRVDIGFQYMEGSQFQMYDIQSTGALVYAAYNVKNKKTCIKLLAGYTQNSLGSIDFSGPLFGLLISPKVYENESVAIIPGAGLSFGFLSVSSTKSIFSDYSDIENPVNAELELNLVSKINKYFNFIIAPSVSKNLRITDGALTYGVNLALLFAFPNQ
ncbi:MAG: hypothetical protein ACM3S2_20690 [Ignavibacteriales bacterium]